MLLKDVYGVGSGTLDVLKHGSKSVTVNSDLRDDCQLFAKIHMVLLLMCMSGSFYLAEMLGIYGLFGCIVITAVLSLSVSLFYELALERIIGKRYFS